MYLSISLQHTFLSGHTSVPLDPHPSFISLMVKTLSACDAISSRYPEGRVEGLLTNGIVLYLFFPVKSLHNASVMFRSKSFAAQSRVTPIVGKLFSQGQDATETSSFSPPSPPPPPTPSCLLPFPSSSWRHFLEAQHQCKNNFSGGGVGWGGGGGTSTSSLFEIHIIQAKSHHHAEIHLSALHYSISLFQTAEESGACASSCAITLCLIRKATDTWTTTLEPEEGACPRNKVQLHP